MKASGSQLVTPLYLKLDASFAWPEQEKVFHLLTGNGLFLCRNHPFFKSSSPVRDWPAELAAHKPLYEIRYPKIPRQLLETTVGFFDLIAQKHGSEAAVLLAWDTHQHQIVPIVPPQVATISKGWYGDIYPIDLEYETPPLPPHLQIIGDIHSHVDGPAYASYTDQLDERHRPGLHLVVGRIRDEPPEFHAEVSVDGTRFRVRDLQLVFEGYHRRRPDDVPPEWMEQVKAESWSARRSLASAGDSTTTYYSSSSSGSTAGSRSSYAGTSGPVREAEVTAPPPVKPLAALPPASVPTTSSTPPPPDAAVS